MPSLLEKIPFNIFNLPYFKKHVRSSNDCIEIAHRRIERSNVENLFERQEMKKKQEAFTGQVMIFR